MDSHYKTNKKETAAKRTTIILDKDEREYIDSLICEGKELGIKPFISKMIEIYRSLMIQDWHFPGEYYCGISRIALVNIELLNILIQQTPKEKWREIGNNMGNALKVSLETTLEISELTKDKWEKVFKRLKIQGFGDIYLKDKYLLVKTPFITESEVLAGILEGLLNVKLDKKNSIPPMIYEIKNVENDPTKKSSDKTLNSP
ncbi:MAG: hypothetical protein GX638_09125 [Crenarchaeota archaeon]|nr:hypothetical protein [Thermoproteota archaeon]